MRLFQVCCPRQVILTVLRPNIAGNMVCIPHFTRIPTLENTLLLTQPAHNKVVKTLYEIF